MVIHCTLAQSRKDATTLARRAVQPTNVDSATNVGSQDDRVCAEGMASVRIVRSGGEGSHPSTTAVVAPPPAPRPDGQSTASRRPISKAPNLKITMQTHPNCCRTLKLVMRPGACMFAYGTDGLNHAEGAGAELG